MRRLSFFALALLFGQAFTALGQETDTTAAVEEPSSPLTISGSVDVYYRANLNADRAWAPNTAFANQPGFALGMANIIFAKEGKKAGAVADLVFGPRGDQAVFISADPSSPLWGGTGNTAIVNQLFAYWKPTDKLRLTLGNFNTFLGYEVISPVANFHYSTSYMFSWGPFSHSGIKAQYAITDKLSALVAVMNPTDFTNFNPVNTYTLGAQLGYSADAGFAYLNFVYGDQDGTIKTGDLDPAEMYFNGDTLGTSNDLISSSGSLMQLDLTTGLNLGEKFYIGLNATYNATMGGTTYFSDSSNVQTISSSTAFGYYGVALYPKFAVSDNFGIGLRGEYLGEINDGYGIIGAYDAGGSANVIALTLSSNIKVGNLTIIPEIRYDQFSQDVVPNGTTAQDNAVSALLAAVYAF